MYSRETTTENQHQRGLSEPQEGNGEKARGEMAAGGASEAQKRFELENSVREVESDTIYNFDGDFQKKLRDQKPWTKESAPPPTRPLPSPFVPPANPSPRCASGGGEGRAVGLGGAGSEGAPHAPFHDFGGKCCSSPDVRGTHLEGPELGSQSLEDYQSIIMFLIISDSMRRARSARTADHTG
jgi:hypothetical protein